MKHSIQNDPYPAEVIVAREVVSVLTANPFWLSLQHKTTAQHDFSNQHQTVHISWPYHNNNNNNNDWAKVSAAKLSLVTDAGNEKKHRAQKLKGRLVYMHTNEVNTLRTLHDKDHQPPSVLMKEWVRRNENTSLHVNCLADNHSLLLSAIHF